MSQQDSVFMRTLVLVILALVVLFVIIVIAAKLVAPGQPDSLSQDKLKKMTEQIEPVGKVEEGSAAGAAAPAAAGGKADGAGVYQSACFACHGTGAAGAPKLGDKTAWKARIAQGNATLYSHALKGFKGMPPKGGNAALADDAVKAAVDHMVGQSK